MSGRVDRSLTCDVLVVGGGGSGALAAVEASRDARTRVLLVSRGPVGMSGLTPTANGGTAAVGAAEDLFALMVRAGRFLNDQNLGWFMLSRIGPALERLKELGIPVVPLRARSVCVLGADTLQKLRARLLGVPNVELREDVLVTRLAAQDGAVTGATALDLRTGEWFEIRAKAVVLATGGSTGELYPHSSNNPFGVPTDACGTGHVLALRAGAELIDMEMIQFVPLPALARGLHIRYFPDFWTGPYRNRLGEVVESDITRYYGESYSPELARLLSREIAEGRGPIYVDKTATPASGKGPVAAWEARKRWIKELGFDPRDRRIEIVVGSHFSMGGVRVNERTETGLPGLYAAGEMMGGVHGGLRLSGYSFTQMIVFGLEAGRQAAAYAAAGPGGVTGGDAAEEERERAEALLAPKEAPVRVGALKARLQALMERHAFVERDAAGLEEGLRGVEALRAELPRLQVPAFRRFNLDWVRALELPFLVDTAECVLRSALARQESRAFHCRTDYPDRDDARWLRHTALRLGDGGLQVDTAPVVLDRMKPEDS